MKFYSDVPDLHIIRQRMTGNRVEHFELCVFDENGEVETGYGINEKYRCQGFMSEALTAISDWALNQSKVLKVIAETEKENTASHKVLQKCGFKKYKETEESYFWYKGK